MRRRLRLVSSLWTIASFIAAAIFVAASAHAQMTSGDVRSREHVSKLVVTPILLAFNKIDLSSQTVSETKSFIVEDTGRIALSVTVAPASGSPCFKIASGQGASRSE
ncbi:MAG TPA: hypothetical protein VJX68_18850 [Candidatus Binatus sp.]|nr:hypothetical protein [Candidatus Binatus sp.]